jgi:hypothetical protein
MKGPKAIGSGFGVTKHAGPRTCAGDAQITEGLEEEMEGPRRVEQQVAQFAARRRVSSQTGQRRATAAHKVRVYESRPLWELTLLLGEAVDADTDWTPGSPRQPSLLRAAARAAVGGRS